MTIQATHMICIWVIEAAVKPNEQMTILIDFFLIKSRLFIFNLIIKLINKCQSCLSKYWRIQVPKQDNDIQMQD